MTQGAKGGSGTGTEVAQASGGATGGAKPQATPAGEPSSAGQVAPETGSPSSTASSPSKVIYRDDKIEEIEHPTQPGVKLRRTVIDEVIVDGEIVPKKGEE